LHQARKLFVHHPIDLALWSLYLDIGDAGEREQHIAHRGEFDDQQSHGVYDKSIKVQNKLDMADWPETPMLPVAWGEVFDKLTILRIKAAQLSDPAKLANVNRERIAIEAVVGDFKKFPPKLSELIGELEDINTRLWGIEDGKRECERTQSFGPPFIQLARDVYIWNDRRAVVKREINALLGSAIVEEKQYRQYR